MVKQSNKKSIFVMLTLILTIISFLVLVLTPTIFIRSTPVWGWTTIFGGKVSLSNTNLLEFNFNWTIYIIWLLILIVGISTYCIGPKSRGYYIFSAIVQILLAIFIFTIGSSWLKTSWIVGQGPANLERMVLGVGPWVSGILAVINALLSIVEFRVVKLR